MLTKSDLVPQACIEWHDSGKSSYGVILSKVFDYCVIPRADPSTPSIRCYDEGGSNRDCDEDLVRLRHCPPPFSSLCPPDEKKCYGDANRHHLFVFTTDELINSQTILDRRALLHDEDYSELLSRVWRDEKEKGRPVKIMSWEVIGEKRKEDHLPELSATRIEFFVREALVNHDLVPRSKYVYGKLDPQKGPDGPSIC